MWTFEISTGRLLSPSGLHVGTGHSGWGDAANDPKMVKAKGIGPLPPGKWSIGPAYNHPKLGPVVMNLDPLPGTEVYGRSLFRIHGDNSTPDPHDASHGCIILSRATRRAISASPVKTLNVIE